MKESVFYIIGTATGSQANALAKKIRGVISPEFIKVDMPIKRLCGKETDCRGCGTTRCQQKGGGNGNEIKLKANYHLF